MKLFTGIWYEWTEEVKEICTSGSLTVSRVHTHIGSGSDPAVWQKVSQCARARIERGMQRRLFGKAVCWWLEFRARWLFSGRGGHIVIRTHVSSKNHVLL